MREQFWRLLTWCVALTKWIHTMWGTLKNDGVQLVTIIPIPMAYGTYNELTTGGYIPTKARFGAPHYMNLTNIWISIQNMGSWNKIWVSEKGQQELFNWPLVPRSHRPKTTARYGTDFTISQFRTDQPALENICTFLKTWCIHCFFNQPVGMEHLLGRSKCNWRLCPWKKQMSDGSQDVIIPQ